MFGYALGSADFNGDGFTDEFNDFLGQLVAGLGQHQARLHVDEIDRGIIVDQIAGLDAAGILVFTQRSCYRLATVGPIFRRDQDIRVTLGSGLFDRGMKCLKMSW